MRTRNVLLLVVTVLALAACDADVNVNAGDPTAGPSPERTDETPLEEIDECAEVSATEGAPAGLTMMDSFFEPPCLAISSTQQVAITNAGNLDHTFTVADGDIDIEVAPGEEVTTDETGTDLPAGTYRFVCRFHEDSDGMVGTLVVE
jgi:plastocyanin